jgi:hypothetical protein
MKNDLFADIITISSLESVRKLDDKKHFHKFHNKNKLI